MQQASRTLQQVPCHSKVQFTYKNKYNELAELAEFIIPPSCCKISTTQKQQFSAARSLPKSRVCIKCHFEAQLDMHAGKFFI